MADEATLAELGARLERVRLERNLSQAELAAECGLERKAIQRLEAGEPVKLTSLIRVLRGLGLLERLDGLVPQVTPSPIELLELHGRSRRRASRRRAKRDATAGAEQWRWEDERRPDRQ
jgi:transcriptional regulator with XRE-family HTH domain